MAENGNKVKRLRRGIYLLPNLFTAGAVFAGFYGIIVAINGQYMLCSQLIFVAMLLDGLDGRVARMTGTQSEFGAQLDSLSDMVSFGLAPALLVYLWSLHQLGKAGWLVAFIFMISTALRLARFNALSQQTNKRYFRGLPCPLAAAMLSSIVWLCIKYDFTGVGVELAVLLMTFVLGLLMVSTVRYRSFKDIDLQGTVPFMAIFFVVLLIVLISLDPPLVFVVIFSTYIVLGLLFFCVRMIKSLRSR